MDITALLVFVAGLLLGGLVNVVVARLPLERGFGGRPRCTRCNRPLVAWQLIPLFGWLAQRGRARCCGRALHWVYPLVELLAGVALLAFYLRYGLTVPFFYLVFVTLVLLMTGAIDWQHRMIYTFFILVPALVAIVLARFVPGHSLVNALVGALAGGFGFALLFLLAKVLFPGVAAPFGLGDVYLAIFIGAAVGLTNMLPALFWGMVLAALFSVYLLVQRSRGKPNVPRYIAYGSFLCVGVVAYVIVNGLGT